MSQTPDHFTTTAPDLEMPSLGIQLDPAATQTAVEWENFFYYSSNIADFGLDTLFEPQTFGEELSEEVRFG